MRSEYTDRPMKHVYGKYRIEPFPLISHYRAITLSEIDTTEPLIRY
jgi:hypothetical protein